MVRQNSAVTEANESGTITRTASGSRTRRRVVQSTLLAVAGAVAGCAGRGFNGGDRDSSTTTQGDDVEATRGNPADGGVRVSNRSDGTRRVAVRVSRGESADDESDSERYTPTASIDPAMFHEEITLSSGESQEFQEVFPVPSAPTRYRVEARTESGGRVGYAFVNRPGSGFLNVVIDLLSPSELRIGHTVT